MADWHSRQRRRRHRPPQLRVYARLQSRKPSARIRASVSNLPSQCRSGGPHQTLAPSHHFHLRLLSWRKMRLLRPTSSTRSPCAASSALALRATQAADSRRENSSPMMALQSEVTRTDTRATSGDLGEITVEEAFAWVNHQGAYASTRKSERLHRNLQARLSLSFSARSSHGESPQHYQHSLRRTWPAAAGL